MLKNIDNLLYSMDCCGYNSACRP